MRPTDLLLVAIGGMVGALARVLAEQMFAPLADGLGLFAANVSGALALASIAVLSDRIAPRVRVFLGTGFCGSFTSVSALNALVALETQGGSAFSGGMYFALSIAFALPLVYWVLGWKSRDEVEGGRSQ